MKPPVCPNGYAAGASGSGCYKLMRFDALESSEDILEHLEFAIQKCGNEGAGLARPTTDTELADIKTHLINVSPMFQLFLT